MSIKWQGEKKSAKFINKIDKLKDKILTQDILTIDPSSGGYSMPG